MQGRQKSRSSRRVFKKTPGGKTVLHFIRRKPKKAKCGKCGAVLPGVPAQRRFRIKKMSKTQKRPSRPYGGVLCSKCTREKLKQQVRQ